MNPCSFRGLVQDQLAERMGTSIRTVYYFERQKKNPEVVNLETLAQAMGAQPGELLKAEKGGTAEEPVSNPSLQRKLNLVHRILSEDKTYIAKTIEMLADKNKHRAAILKPGKKSNLGEKRSGGLDLQVMFKMPKMAEFKISYRYKIDFAKQPKILSPEDADMAFRKVWDGSKLELREDVVILVLSTAEKADRVDSNLLRQVGSGRGGLKGFYFIWEHNPRLRPIASHKAKRFLLKLD